jgi:hypothetical protein
VPVLGILSRVSTPVRVTRGIWRPRETVDTLLGRVAATLRALPPGTVVGGLTAARLHGLWLPGDAPAAERIEVIVRPARNPQQLRSYNRRPEVRARRQQLLPDEVAGGCPGSRRS